MAPAELAALVGQARAWAAQDIDPETKTANLQLCERASGGDADASAQLRAAFNGRLSFGTAGLRGRLGPGPAQMNRMVVTQTSAGFAEFLRARAAGGAISAVVGYDGRTNSRAFALDTAEVLAGAGIAVTLLPEPAPTPLLAFAVREIAASAGVMITASHNPPGDNGYKVYLGDADGGSQIVSPADAEITACIAQVAARPLSEIARSSDYRIAGDEIASAYVARTAAGALQRLPSSTQPALKIVYTAMHGVGGRLLERVFTACALPLPVPVAAQHAPDGNFPTVKFPNPEEEGALDLAFAAARHSGAELIIAHDPDADRLAVAVPDAQAQAGYRRLSGNELGLLLGWQAAENAAQEQRERQQVRGSARDLQLRGALATTIVSSPALKAVAADYGFTYCETLSGFKWVSRVPQLIFGYEEALGYLTQPEVVHDKDGISAALAVVTLALQCRERGTDLPGMLEEAAKRFGHFASAQNTVRLQTQAEVAQLALKIRRDPPTAFGKLQVSATDDLLLSDNPDLRADVLHFTLTDGSRVMIRPSGTEAKLKVYLDTCCKTGNVRKRRERAEQTLRELTLATQNYLAALQG